MNYVDILIYFSLFWFFVSMPLMILTAVFFGKLIKLQTKYWMLAKRGFHKVEHMGEDRIVRTFFLRPVDDHFEIEGGIYFHQKDAMLKSSNELMKKVDKKLLDKEDKTVKSAEEKEILALLKQIKKLKYSTDSVFTQWGIPTLYYYGNDPNPLNPAERKKIYDSKVMFAYIRRLLLDKEWKFVKKVMILTIIGWCLTLVIALLFWGVYSGQVKNLGTCQAMLNVSQQTIAGYLNATLERALQNTTIIL